MKVAVLAVLGLSVAGFPVLAADPDLVGTWVGERERIAANEDAYTKGPMTLVITGQNGRTFTGHLRRTYADKDAIEESLWGAFTPRAT
jgi:hypothetical protein